MDLFIAFQQLDLYIKAAILKVQLFFITLALRILDFAYPITGEYEEG